MGKTKGDREKEVERETIRERKVEMTKDVVHELLSCKNVVAHLPPQLAKDEENYIPLSILSYSRYCVHDGAIVVYIMLFILLMWFSLS